MTALLDLLVEHDCCVGYYGLAVYIRTITVAKVQSEMIKGLSLICLSLLSRAVVGHILYLPLDCPRSGSITLRTQSHW